MPPRLSKVFGVLSIGSPASTTLTFTLLNPNHVVTLDALQFSDTLPTGLVISTLSRSDETGELQAWFEGPLALSAAERERIQCEEGWILWHS